jgi:hypothetical protein
MPRFEMGTSWTQAAHVETAISYESNYIAWEPTLRVGTTRKLWESFIVGSEKGASVLMRPEGKGGVSIFETPSSWEGHTDCQRLQRGDQAKHSQEAGASNDSCLCCCVVGSNPNTFIVRLASSGSKPSWSEVSTCGKYKSKFCVFGWVSNLKL